MMGRGYDRSSCHPLVVICLFALAATVESPLTAQQIWVLPNPVVLVGPESSAQVVVDADDSVRGAFDLTSRATFRIEDNSVAVVSASGRVEASGDGTTALIAQIDGKEYRTSIQVRQFDQPAAISYHNDVNPVLTKSGCNSGSCHGKAEGKNGFRLSLFGFDAAADHEALTRQGRGRRINLAAAEASLLLRKGTGMIPHGGGQAVAAGSFGYRRMLRWIEEGAKLDRDIASPVARIEVTPEVRTLRVQADQQELTQQLRVIAYDSDGNMRDVTAESAYETNAPTIAEVDTRGRVQAAGVPGEAAILVRYLGHIAVSRIGVPRQTSDFVRPPENNFVDNLVWDKLQEMGIKPSGLCDDASFLRRASLDVIGTLPTATEAREFLSDVDSDKRARLVDRLLERPEYASYWSLLWADIMRVDANALGPNRSVAMVRWLREQFAHNRPYDQMAREILTARGNMQRIAPTAIYTSLKQPTEAASAISQLFLGVRIECAQCHHHPFERWSQRDFYALAGFFTGIKQKSLPDGSSALVLTAARDLKHPRTGEMVPSVGLGQPHEAEATEVDPLAGLIERDRRERLAAWMTDSSNPFFARAIANRMWAHYFGRGLVEPVDDLRASNPATNEPLLDALAEHLRDTGYDLKAFTRTLLNSRVYQASGETNETNVADEQYFSHAESRALPAEVLLDAICQVTGSPEKFNGWPLGARAIEVWDNRMPSYFFRIFGRPQRTTVCACERGNSPSISQALHLMNSPELGAKISDRGGSARRWAEANWETNELLDEIYLTMLARQPTPAERELMSELFADLEANRQPAIEDIMWALMNSKEFLYNH